jgi:hypothetical protein
MRARTYTRTHMHTTARTHASTRTHTHSRTTVCTHARTHARSHTHTHARAHAHARARTHARTHSRVRARKLASAVPLQTDCGLQWPSPIRFALQYYADALSVANVSKTAYHGLDLHQLCTAADDPGLTAGVSCHSPSTFPSTPSTRNATQCWHGRRCAPILPLPRHAYTRSNEIRHSRASWHWGSGGPPPREHRRPGRHVRPHARAAAGLWIRPLRRGAVGAAASGRR